MFGSPYLEWAATSFTVQYHTHMEILAFGYGGLSRSNLSPEVKCPPGASYFKVNRPPFEVICPPLLLQWQSLMGKNQGYQRCVVTSLTAWRINKYSISQQMLADADKNIRKVEKVSVHKNAPNPPCAHGGQRLLF